MFKVVFEGTKESIEEKINNPFWGTIILTWITWNWKVWYLTFFVSEEKIINNNIHNKIDYIKDLYNYFDFYNLFPFLGFIFNWIIMPICLSFFIVFFIIPKISHKFLEMHERNKDKENKLFIKELKSDVKKDEEEINKLKQELEKEKIKYGKEIEMKKQEINKLKIESDKNTLEEKKLNDEYKILINKYPNLIKEFKELIVEYKGENHRWEQRTGRIKNISSSSEEVLIFNDLVEEVERTENGNVIIYKPTPKGKYFLKKDTLEN